MGDEVACLFALGAQLRAERRPLHAVKAYEAICISNRALPRDEVRARLHIADILLEHTYNALEAKTHADRAHLVSVGRSSATVPWSLRCWLADVQGRCCRTVCSGAEELQALERGLEACGKEDETFKMRDVAEWRCRLSLQACRAHLAPCDAKSEASASRAADLAGAAAAEMERAGHTDLAALARVHAAQAALVAGELADAAGHLTSASDLLASSPVGSAAIKAHVELVQRLLHLLLALQDGTGRGALSAAVRSAAEACEAVVVLSQGSDGARGTEGPSTETWECVLYLASAAVALPEGKEGTLEKAEADAQRGLEANTEGLAKLGVAWPPPSPPAEVPMHDGRIGGEAGDAAVASPHASAPAPPSNGDASHLRNGTASVRHPSHGLPLPVHHPRAGGAAVLAELRFSLLEILAQAQLTRVGVREALGSVQEMMQLLSTFHPPPPHLLARLHLACGLLAHTAGRVPIATRHFAAAARHAPPATRLGRLARAYQALAHLESGPDGLGPAMEGLTQVASAEAEGAPKGPDDGLAVLYARALAAAVREGRGGGGEGAGEAVRLLKEALKSAHKHLGVAQVTLHVMTQMAAVDLAKGNAAVAQEYAKTAVLMADPKDILGQLGAMQVVVPAMEAQKESHAADVASTQAWVRDQRSTVESSVAAAQRDVYWHEVLAFGLGDEEEESDG